MKPIKNLLLILVIVGLAISVSSFPANAKEKANLLLAMERLGYIDISSSPAGATVYINGVPKGVTPIYRYPAEPGWVRIRISLKGYKDYTTSIYVREGRRENVFATLRRYNESGPSITVTSTPSNAEVYIDGYSVGKTPLRNLSMETGTFTIEVRKAGYHPSKRTVHIKYKRHYTYHFKLKREGAFTVAIMIEDRELKRSSSKLADIFKQADAYRRLRDIFPKDEGIKFLRVSNYSFPSKYYHRKLNKKNESYSNYIYKWSGIYLNDRLKRYHPNMIVYLFASLDRYYHRKPSPFSVVSQGIQFRLLIIDNRGKIVLNDTEKYMYVGFYGGRAEKMKDYLESFIYKERPAILKVYNDIKRRSK